MEEKLKRGFDQEKEILDRLAKIPKEQSLFKIRELMKEVNYWQERFSQSDARLEEYRVLPMKLEEVEIKLQEELSENISLKHQLEESREKITMITQQKARMEGELVGKGAQISKLNELEGEKETLKIQMQEWKSKYEKLNTRFSDKKSIENKYSEVRKLLNDRETRLKSLTEEVNRLNQLILEKKVENDKLKGRAVRLDEIQIMYQKEREIRENEIKSLRSRLGDDGTSHEWKNLKREYISQIEALKNELARTVEDKKSKVLENENLKKDLSDLHVELRLKDDLAIEIQDKEKRIKATLEELNRLNDVLGSTVSSYEQSQLKLNEYENKIIMLTTEIQRLNGLLRTKNEENDVMKLRFGEMDTRFHAQKEKYEERISQINIEMEKLKSKVKTLEAAKALEINHLKIKLDDFKKVEGKEGVSKEELKGKELASGKLKRPEKEPLDEIKKRMKKEMMLLDERNRVLKEDNDHIRRQADNWREELERIEQENALLREKIGHKPGTGTGLSEVQQRDVLNKSAHLQRIAHESNQIVLSLEAENRELKDQLNRALNEINRLSGGQEGAKDSSAFVENEQLRIENNELIARINLMAENYDLLQKKLSDLENLYQNQKHMTTQHFNEIDNLQKAHSEHRMIKTTIEREKQGIERAFEELKYRYATLELESRSNLQRLDSEWQAKYQKMENEYIAKYNKLEVEWNANFQNSQGQWKIEYDRYLIELQAKEKVEETYEARSKEYEEKVALYAGECEKLRQILTDKEEEIQDFKEKLKELDAVEKEDLQNNISKLKQMLEIKLNELDAVSLQRDQLQREVDEQQIFDQENEKTKELLHLKNQEIKVMQERTLKMGNFVQEKEIIENELAKLSKILEEKVMENEEWRDKYQRLETLLYEKGGLEARCLDFEDKERRFHNEIDRLAHESKLKSQENEQLLRKLRGIEIAMNDSINLQHEILRLKNILEEKLEEIDNWKSKCSRFEAILNEKGSLEGRSMEYERKIEMLTRDMEKLGFVYREKARENEELKVNLAKMDSQISDRSLLEGEIRKLKDILEGKLQEIDNLKAKNSGLELALQEKDGSQLRFRDYEEKIRALSNELEKVSSILRAKHEEIEEWRLKWAKIEGNLHDRELLETEIMKLKGILEYKLQEIENLKAFSSKTELKLAEIGQTEGRLKEYESKVQYMHQELEKMSNLLRMKHEEVEAMKLKCSKYETNLRDEAVLASEFGKMKDILEKKLSELDDSKAKCSQYEILINEMTKQEPLCKEMQKKIDILTREIEKLSSVLKEKASEIEEWRLKYSKLEASIRDREGLEVEIFKLKEILQVKIRELDEWKSRYAKMEVYLSENSGLEGKIQDYENKIFNLMKEIERLGQVLQGKITELDEARGKISRLETYNRDTEVLERELRNMKEILGGKLIENDDLRANNTKLEYHLSEKGNYDDKLREYEDKVSLLANELEKMSRFLREKTEENEELRTLLAKLEGGSRDRDFLTNELLRMKSLFSQKMSEMDEQRQRLAIIPAMKQEMKSLENQISAANQEIQNLSQYILPEKNQQIESLRLKLLEYEGKFSEKDIMLRDKDQMRGILAEKNKEIDGLKVILAQYEKNKHLEMENLTKILETKRLAHVETNLKANSNQIEELKGKLKQSLLEAEQWRFQAHQLKTAQELEINRFQQAKALSEELLKKNELLEQENITLKHQIEILYQEKEGALREIEVLKLRNGVSGEEFEGLRRNCEIMSGENAKLIDENNLLKETIEKITPEFHFKVNENEELKKRLDEISSLKQENTQLRAEIERCIQQQERMKQEIENSMVSEENFRDFESKITGLQRDLKEKSDEIKKWKLNYENLEGKLQDTHIKNAESENEIKRLEGLLEERNQELEHLLRENNELKGKILLHPRLEGQQVESPSEGQHIKRLLGDKIIELDDLKQKYEDTLQMLQKKQEEIEHLKTGINEISSRYKKDMGNMEKKIKDLRLSEENLLIRAKNAENDLYFSKKPEELEEELKRMNDQMVELRKEVLNKEIEISKLKEKNLNLEHENFLSLLKKRDSFCFSEV